MLPPATSRATIQQAGFSLLELLVVVFIIGILATMFTLSVGVIGNDEELETEAKRLNALIELAREEAILQGREYGLKFYPDRYEFSFYREVFDDNPEQQAQSEDEPQAQDRWIILRTDLLGSRALPQGILVELTINNQAVILKEPEESSQVSADGEEEEEYRPQIFLLSSGDMSPFSIRLRREFTSTEILMQYDELGLMLPEVDGDDAS